MSGLSSIVVGVDFTPCSTGALRHAIRIAGWSGAALHVSHVIDTVVVIELEEALSPLQERIREGLVKDAQAAWRQLAEEVPGAEALPIEISINNRVVGILRRTREARAELLVLGAFGDRPPDVGVGTLATACVRSSAADVLLVRDTQAAGTPLRTIVAAVDFSDTSLLALERAATFAAHDGAELHVVHVLQAPWLRLRHRASAPEPTPALQAQHRAGLERRLAEICARVRAQHPALRIHAEVFDYRGHRSGIVEYAAGVSAQLVVLGTRGRTNLRDILLGSTAEKVLAESRCSILAVKPKGPQEERRESRPG